MLQWSALMWILKAGKCRDVVKSLCTSWLVVLSGHLLGLSGIDLILLLTIYRGDGVLSFAYVVFNSFIWLIVNTIRWVRGFLWLSGSHHMAFRYFAFIYIWRYPLLLFGRIWALLDQGHFRTSAKLCLTSVFISNVACIMRWSPRSVWGMLFWFAMRWRLLSMKDHP